MVRLGFRVIYSGFWTPKWELLDINAYCDRLYLASSPWDVTEFERDCQFWEDAPLQVEYPRLPGGDYWPLVLWDGINRASLTWIKEEEQSPSSEPEKTENPKDVNEDDQ